MLAKSAVAVALLAAFAAAQTNDNSTIDAGSVPATTRSQWCNAQQNTCPLLCGGTYKDNDCDVGTLIYKCTCNNGTAPGLMYYQQTLPTFICEQVYQNCIAAGANNAQAQKLCDSNKAANCGTLDPSKYTAPASTSSSATQSPTSTGAGAASATVASTSSSKAAAATMAAVAQYGSGVLAAGAAAAFGLLL